METAELREAKGLKVKSSWKQQPPKTKQQQKNSTPQACQTPIETQTNGWTAAIDQKQTRLFLYLLLILFFVIVALSDMIKQEPWPDLPWKEGVNKTVMKGSGEINTPASKKFPASRISCPCSLRSPAVDTWNLADAGEKKKKKSVFLSKPLHCLLHFLPLTNALQSSGSWMA